MYVFVSTINVFYKQDTPLFHVLEVELKLWRLAMTCVSFAQGVRVTHSSFSIIVE